MFSLESIWIFLKKNVTKKDIAAIIVLILLFLSVRLINLDKWPQFSDEGIYINWAKVAWKDASWRFISVTDGRQPLQTWATIPFLKLFSPNDLFAGRMFAVASGFAGFIGMFVLLFYLWGKKAAYIGALLYIFLPYLVFYERIALVDAAVNAGFIWILLFSFILVRTRRLDIAIIMGFIGGMALLAKSSSRMFLGLTAAAPILLFGTKTKKLISQSINYFFLLGVVAAISLLFYNVQRLSPYFHYVAQKNTTFILTREEFFAAPFAYFQHNVWNIPLYITWESGWFIIPISIAGLFLLFKKEKLTALYLSVFILVPYFAIALFARVLFPRYVLFYSTLVIITAVYFFLNIKSIKLRNTTLGVLLLSMMLFNYPFLFDPARASFPPVDRGQYVEGLTSVWGAEELMATVQQNAETRPTLVLAEGDFGLVADVLRVYDQPEDTVEIKGLWPLAEEHLYEYQPELENRDVYVVFSHQQEFPDHWPIELVARYDKPENKKALYLFKLLKVSDEPSQ